MLHALHVYWRPSADLFVPESLKAFDGRLEAKELLDMLLMRMSCDHADDNLSELVRTVRLLYHFDKDLHDLKGTESSAVERQQQSSR